MLAKASIYPFKVVRFNRTIFFAYNCEFTHENFFSHFFAEFMQFALLN